MVASFLVPIYKGNKYFMLYYETLCLRERLYLPISILLHIII